MENDEGEVRKTVVYREGSSNSPRTILPIVVAVVIIAAALLFFIFSRL